MNAAPAPARPVRGSRPQRVPPALLRGAEPIEGAAVLDELRDELGLLLFRSLRNVLIWAQLSPQERPGAFAGAAGPARAAELEAAAPPPELLAPLSVIAELLAAPGAVDERRLALACRRVALWAEDLGALGTALEFTQAAALVRPDAATLAYAVGRLARRRAEYDRAESWFTRAIIQGRQTRDWRAYASAFSGLGNLNLQRGNLPAARRAHHRCLRAALRHGVPEMAAESYHNLLAVAVHAGDDAQALREAEMALAAYGPAHPKVPRLAFDVAYHWVLQGRFGQALRVGRALLPGFTVEAERLLVHGLIARAAGGAGAPDDFDRAAGKVLRASGEEKPADTASGALVGVAHGAASLGRWEQAEDAAGRLLRLAGARGEGELVMMAEALLDSIRGRRRTEAAAPAGDAGQAEVLAAELESALSCYEAVAA